MIFAFEGPDGSGKSTVAKAVATLLNEEGIKAVAIRAPGTTKLGEAIRQLILMSGTPMEPEQISLIFAAEAHAYMAHARNLLSTGEAQVVVMDRCYLSNFAYRYADGMDWNKNIDLANNWLAPLLPPNQVFCMMASEEVRAARLKKAGHPVDRFEARGMPYQRRVVEGYVRAIAEGYATEVDASQPLENIVGYFASYIETMLSFPKDDA